MSQVALDRSKTYFEEFVAWCPDPFKGVARAVTETVAWPLELVAGDPDELMEAARECQVIGDTIRGLADLHGTNVQAVTASWSGEAASAFGESMTGFRGGLGDLAGGFDQLKQILVDAANASVDAFNLILDIIFELLLWLATELILAAVAAALSYGVSAIATAVRVFARLATTLSKISSVIARLARVLERLATKLDDIAKFLKMYGKKMLELRKAKKAYSPWKAKAYSKEGAAFQLDRLKWVLPGKTAVNAVSPIGIPGVTGVGLDAVMGYRDVSDGKKDRNYVTDGTYRDITGPYTRPIQDLIDTLE